MVLTIITNTFVKNKQNRMERKILFAIAASVLSIIMIIHVHRLTLLGLKDIKEKYPYC